jgi:arylsulfatase
MTADVDIPQGGAEGMINTSGGRFGGYGFYLLKSKPVFVWNLLDLKRVRWEAPEALTPGSTPSSSTSNMMDLVLPLSPSIT